MYQMKNKTWRETVIMKSMKELFLQFAKKQGVTTKETPESIQVMAAGKKGNWTAHFQTLEKEHMMIFTSILGIKVDENKRKEIALKLTRINYIVKIGAFQMNPENGELSFRTTHYVVEDKEDVAEELIGRLVLLNFTVVDTYYESIRQEVDGEV